MRCFSITSRWSTAFSMEMAAATAKNSRYSTSASENASSVSLSRFSAPMTSPPLTIGTAISDRVEALPWT